MLAGWPDAGPARAAQPDRLPMSLTGRLATVEPAARRITVVPDGAVDLVELFVAPEGKVTQGDRELSLAELVIQTGRRVQIDYYADGMRRLALRVTVEAEPAAPARAPATPASRLPRAL